MQAYKMCWKPIINEVTGRNFSLSRLLLYRQAGGPAASQNESCTRGLSVIMVVATSLGHYNLAGVARGEMYVQEDLQAGSRVGFE
jgi:hypothetical protein